MQSSDADRSANIKRRGVVILGSTGSIGTQALDVIATRRDLYRVLALGAGGGNLELLAEQAITFNVPCIGVANPATATELRTIVQKRWASEGRTAGGFPEILAGADAIENLATSWGEAAQSEGVDSVVVLNGITGSVGLAPTLAALSSGATLALANKESIVAGGALVRAAMTRPGQIVPVDSEHSAIAQALRSGLHHRGLTSPSLDGKSDVRRIILTASGGPFRGMRRSQLADVTPARALAHPTWDMGPVVTINSSTLMNKGLELIEAAYLFDMPAEDIVPVVHPQSVIHSMVEFHDGATIAQASPPDMRLPIALGLSWPERLDRVSTPNRWNSPVQWTFEPLDLETFPAVQVARDAVAASPLHPAVMNAANEECVAAFLQERLPYLGIVDTVVEVLGEFSGPSGILDMEAVHAAEDWARARARELIALR
ncbi:1-deoxy-D-xylulose-5-phosphate reductoisomerase [Actinobaculum sp. 352]|uniref:1-deoxy-D-xylulose-5-phosphate reductoisomerase n=1 Tax=Actinobaculum sp. 352 TaxID=2490946 RepID=UPI0019D1C482|nr:1-deoxy-D-xylulose-5-phosphate reductoisomerase [Actinobaculum sp. 352]